MANKCHVGVPALAQATTNFKLIEIPLPPLTIQKRIANVLCALDSKIELNNRIHAQLEAMTKSIYDFWFVQFDFPDTKGKPYKNSGGEMVWNEELKREIPKDWKVKKLSEIANIVMGQSPPGESYNDNKDGIIFFQGCTDFGNRFPTIRQYTTRPTRFAKAGDILLSVRAPVGMLNIANVDCSIGRGLATLSSKSNANAFLYGVLMNFKQIFDRRNVDGTTFGSIIKEDLYSLKVLVPTDNLITQYQNKVNAAIFKQSKLALENQTLSQLRDWLLPMLMNGQIKVSALRKAAPIGRVLNIIEEKKATKQAMIIALALDEHTQHNKALYRVRAEKIVGVEECHLNEDFGRQPLKEAAGSADFNWIVGVVEPLAVKNKWLEIKEEQVERNGQTVIANRYEQGSKYKAFLKSAKIEFKEKINEAKRIIALFAKLEDTREAEIKSTVYAAWNNLIIREEEATVDTILFEARQNWDPKKLLIPRWKFIEGMYWLIENDLIPKGTGKEVLKKAE